MAAAYGSGGRHQHQKRSPGGCVAHICNYLDETLEIERQNCEDALGRFNAPVQATRWSRCRDERKAVLESH